MTLELQSASPGGDPRVAALIDSAFARAGHESRLAEALSRAHPAYDPGLAMLALEDGEPLGCALWLPRELRLRGTWIRAAVAATFGVSPTARRRGVGRFLARTAEVALRDRSIRAAVVIGAPEFFGPLGFEPAFGAYIVRAPLSVLEEEGDPARWVGLAERHLEPLRELQEACYAEVDGSERRAAAAIDWEGAAEQAYTLVLEGSGSVEGFVRFRVRAELEVTECGARDPGSVRAVLGLFRRLAREHRRGLVEVHVPPPHPVARELFLRGAVCEASSLGGASQMKVVDWPGLFSDLRPWWRPALARRRRRTISIGVGEQCWRLDAGSRWRAGEGRVVAGRDPVRHLALPAGTAAGLLTGQRCAGDLLFDQASLGRSTLDAEGVELVRELFSPRSAMWTYAPAFELADE